MTYYTKLFNSLTIRIISVVVAVLGYTAFILSFPHLINRGAGIAIYLLAVILCARYWGLIAGIVAGIGGSLLAGLFCLILPGNSELFYVLAETLLVYMPTGTIIGKLRDEKHRLECDIEKVKLVKDLLPICSVCKKVRDTDGSWHKIEIFLEMRSGVIFTHSYCPECARELYANLKEYI